MKSRNGAIILMLLTLSLLLMSCSAAAEAQAETAEPVVVEAYVPTVSVTGVVVPAHWASLSVNGSGVVKELLVEEGAEVQEGDVLLQLSGREHLEAAVTAATLELISAEQNLQDVYDNSELSTSQAQLEMANARDNLDDTEYHWQVQQEGYRANGEVIARARANLVLAQNQVDRASSDYNRYSGQPNDSTQKALARANLADARILRDSIERNLNWYLGHPTELEQAVLDAELALAEAQLLVAEQEYGLVEAGPSSELLELAEARLANARAAYTAADQALTDSALTAPYSGTITTINVRENEWISPGIAAMLIADLSSLQVETTDLSEIDVPLVMVGSPVTVTFDALPDLVLDGTVVRIAEKASEGAGVNYTVIIELDTIPEQIRWGMTAFVDIDIESGN
ncbi:MAG: HlyD family efflux transporter periplasmic adaptor subunit [Anaerolineales bacterium]|nr:HlyD family efflux transporter periplasmic adaptor subunit [Anaerolineales bacterium]